MQRIGNYRVDHEGGRWQITNRYGSVISAHHNKWDAIQQARCLNWQDVHEKRRPPIGGREEPKSKWRWSYIGGTHG
jgi:hypothetical protein